MDKIRQYEKEKAEIERTAASYEEYNERIMELIKRLKI